MKKEVVFTSCAPAAIGPYSQAIKHGNMVFTSGQIPIDPGSGEIIGGDIESQTRQVLKNLQNVLAAAGASLDNTIKTTLFIKDMNDFNKVNLIYGEFFKTSQPARSCVEVSKLPKNVLIEIEAVACIG